MKKNKKLKIFIIILVVAIIIAVAILIAKIMKKQQKGQESNTIDLGTEQIEKEEIEEEPPKEVKIFKGTDRPIAVMIDNHSGAWPQSGLSQAYMIYEIIVEGGETRLMALFKGVDVEEIGPVRSSRHYFLDYALENDAIYTHYGWSPQAESDIKTLKVNNINGITESSTSFWRTKQKSAPHNVLTTTENIKKIAERKGYSLTSNEESVLNYNAEEINLTEEQGAQVCTTITIPHSTLQTVKYEYDEKNKVYKRYARKKLQTEMTTEDALTTKNIIVMFADNYDLNDGSGKGRQNLKNIGTFDGYYITNGKAIKIKCTKKSRTAQTIYKDLDGNEIEVNDGNTFVNICPKSAKVTIK